MLALLLLTGLAVAQKKRRIVQAAPTPPSLNLSSDASAVTLCARDQTQASPRIHLNANASSADGLPIRY
ncbi:MAG TPA: hypothetical protein VE775_09110, partial [Pyrinomonadaceae bacterium]|nr:hypothetical protein [Pyrinomonadaceae bacterium]